MAYVYENFAKFINKKNVFEFFRDMYRKELEDVLKRETSGHFERFLISVCAASRDEQNYEVDVAKAAEVQKQKVFPGYTLYLGYIVIIQHIKVSRILCTYGFNLIWYNY